MNRCRYNKNNCVRVVKEMYQFLQGRRDSRSYNHQIRNWFRKSPMGWTVEYYPPNCKCNQEDEQCRKSHRRMCHSSPNWSPQSRSLLAAPRHDCSTGTCLMTPKNTLPLTFWLRGHLPSQRSSMGWTWFRRWIGLDRFRRINIGRVWMWLRIERAQILFADLWELSVLQGAGEGRNEFRADSSMREAMKHAGSNEAGCSSCQQRSRMCALRLQNRDSYDTAWYGFVAVWLN